MKNQIFIIRHGETAWSKSGRHTGLTDLPLTENGIRQVEYLKNALSKYSFKHVFSSPLKRALDTCHLCGFKEKVMIEKDLVEWNYGEYEGLKTDEIRAENPKWNIFIHGAPGGESVEMISQRADRFIKKLDTLHGNIAVFSSGHFSRGLAARWIEQPVQLGQRFNLSTASLSILGYERESKTIQLWNYTED